MDDYVSKPVTALGLAEVLDRHLKGAVLSGVSVQGRKPWPDGPVDIEQIREITEGDTEFECELIETFLADSEDQIHRLEVALAKNDAEEVRVRAHTIKGSSANAGARDVREHAHRIERMGADEELSGTPEAFSRLKEAFERSREYLLDYLGTLRPAERERLSEGGDQQSPSSRTG